LDAAGIHYFDLYPISAQAIEDGVNVQEAGGHWHPSEDVSALFARFLFEQGMLAETPQK
jgi:hypothetical protein